MKQAFVEDHREYLTYELSRRVRRRPFYSQRAFARDLGLAPSTLTDVLKDRIALSSGRIFQISKNLGLSPEQRDHWVDLMKSRFSRNPQQKSESLIKIRSRIEAMKNAITLDEFKTIAEWRYLAFLELIEMDSKKYSNLKLTSQALGIPLKDMKISVQRLIDLKLVTFDESAKLYQVDLRTQIGNAAPSMAIRQFHSQILSKAQSALDVQSTEERFNSSTMIGLPIDKIPQVMAELQSLALKVLEPYVDASKNLPKEKLYCLSLQFFNLLTDKGTVHESH